MPDLKHPTDSRAARRSVLSTIGVAIVLVAAACSNGGGAATGDRPDLPASSTDPRLPEVTVWDVSESEWVQFADLTPSDQPTLMWFWAPHCPACAAEAPDVKEFAENNEGRVNMVGIGTQDDPEMAAEFVDRHEIDFPMLWDETFETWNAFGIASQPATVLLSADGEVLEGWLGGLPEDRVLELLDDPSLAAT